MRTIAVASVVALGLSGCATLDEYLGGTQEELARICRTEPLVYAAYVGFDPTPSRSVQEAHQVVTDICANPPADSAQALVVVSNAFAKVLSARAKVEGEQ